MSKKRQPHWVKLNDSYLVYQWSQKFSRFVNTHKFENQKEADLTVKQRQYYDRYTK